MHRTRSFTRGTHIWLRGDRWSVVATTPHADCTSLRVLGCGATNSGLTRTYLLPFDHAVTLNSSARPRFVAPMRWWRTVQRALANRRPFGGLDAIAHAPVRILPFQLEPAIAMLRHGHLRLLIADEVGLGKTIQAGIVLAQLQDEAVETRAIVVTPAGLRQQWQHELKARFRLDSVIADTRWLGVMATQLRSGVNPWSLPGIYLTSIDFIRRPEALRPLQDVTWDAVVVDEAHNATSGTARLDAVDVVASRSRRVLLLTATPPDADPRHAVALDGIGRLSTDDDLTVFRRTRADVGIPTSRKTVLLAVRLSPVERQMHRVLRRYCRRLWTEADRRDDAPARLTAVLLTKRALSSAAALSASATRRLELLDGHAEPAARQLSLPLADEDPLADAVGEELLATRGFEDVPDERRQLVHLCELASIASRTIDSKTRFLERLLLRVQEPAVVFTEYRDTLARLGQHFAAHRPLLLHGGLTPAERADVCTAFRRQGSLLLATDAAAEGLNLHARCRLVVHLELPWTPARLEQRTGRVDRLGQRRRVHEVLLVARHTAERVVLAPLMARLRASGGPPERRRLLSLSESTVAARILGTTGTVAGDPVPSHFSSVSRFDPEGLTEAIRLLGRRKHTAPGSCGGPPQNGAVLVTANHGSHDVTIVTSVRFESSTGEVIGDHVLALVAQRTSLWTPVSRSSAIGLCRQLLERHAEEFVRAAERYMADSPCSDLAGAAAVQRALERREQAMALRLRNTSRALVQAGLFERRAVDAADARARTYAVLLEESHSRVAAIRARANARMKVRVLAVHLGRLTDQ